MKDFYETKVHNELKEIIDSWGASMVLEGIAEILSQYADESKEDDDTISATAYEKAKVKVVEADKHITSMGLG